MTGPGRTGRTATIATAAVVARLCLREISRRRQSWPW